MGARKENSRERKFDWAFFAQSYLLISRLACLELLSRRTNKHSKTDAGAFPFNPGDLYVPILFNIKHGIEVFVKALTVFAYDEYEEKSHDIKTLFSDAKEEISKKKLAPRQKGFYDDISQDDINALLPDLEQIEKLVLYFFELEFLRKKLSGSFVISDISNDVFRYPDSKATIRINWRNVLMSQIELSEIENILKKLNNLYDLFGRSTYLFAVLSR